VRVLKSGRNRKLCRNIEAKASLAAFHGTG
jgi:hypothetical protein